MRPLAASLQPDTGAGGNLAGGELNTVVAADADGAARNLRRGGLAGDGGIAASHLGTVALLTGVLGQQGLDVAHERQVRVSPVASGGDDEVDIEDLVVGAVGLGGERSDSQAHRVWRRRFEAHHIGRVADPVRPPPLVASQLPQLVVHALVQVLDQPQAHYAVVGRARVVYECLPVLGRPREQVVDERGVEYRVDAGGDGQCQSVRMWLADTRWGAGLLSNCVSKHGMMFYYVVD